MHSLLSLQLKNLRKNKRETEEIIVIKGQDLRPRDISIMGDQLIELTVADLKPLPAPFDKPEMEPGFKAPKPDWNEKYNSHLDGFIAIDTFERPKTKEEEDELVQKFLRGVERPTAGFYRH